VTEVKEVKEGITEGMEGRTKGWWVMIGGGLVRRTIMMTSLSVNAIYTERDTCIYNIHTYIYIYIYICIYTITAWVMTAIGTSVVVVVVNDGSGSEWWWW
jgi:hypothetical protein